MRQARKPIYKNKALKKSVECIECESDLVMTREEFETATDLIADLLLKNYLREAEKSEDIS